MYMLEFERWPLFSAGWQTIIRRLKMGRYYSILAKRYNKGRFLIVLLYSFVEKVDYEQAIKKWSL